MKAVPPTSHKPTSPENVVEKLEPYRRKRAASRTPEPFGRQTDAPPRLFVVQKHAARKLHYDFRLEMGGVLVSWAVPKGPSLDPAEKRLAVHVEDHPVEYAEFEGIIPQGNYGAGAVIVWDRGLWIPLDEPEEGMEKGKLLFELRGYKLRGVWTLVRTKRPAGSRGPLKDWLLIKKPDAYAASGAQLPEESVLSGLTLEELRDGGGQDAAIRAELEKLEAPRRRVRPDDVELMLASTAERPFSGKGWLFELKYDGFRLLAARENEQPRLSYRHGQDATSTFPEVTRALAALPYGSIVMDGEVVVTDEAGRPSFQGLQKRVHLSRPADIGRAAIELPATLFLFDLLGFEDYDLRPLPLLTRKSILQRILPRRGPLRYADHIEERGEEFFEEVRRMGLEGVIAKKAGSRYCGGRSPDWIKLRVERTGDFVVVGFTEPARGRVGMGALHLAVCEAGRFIYAGRVGTGLSDQQLLDLRRTLDAVRRPRPCFEGPLPAGRGHVWVEPTLVCEVRYKEMTEEGLLRQPVFVRLRDDKRPEECAPPADQSARNDPPPPPPEPAAVERTVRFSNLEKVFWPDEGYTKGDLIDYYRAVSPWLLHYLRDRPLVMTRYPDGITGKSFFQKDAPGFAPAWLRTERMWSEDAARDIDYFICDDEASLLYVINLGTIPLHIWSSRVQAIQRPDWCILDLDPKGAPFENVVKVALAIRPLCDEIGLPCHVKTSGSTGLHVLVPLGRQCTFEQSRSLGELLARVVAGELPEIATTARAIGARGGRVYIDYLQNGHGKLLAAPFSARPVPGALVSTPLRWREVNARLDPSRFTIKTVPERMKKMKEDPLAPVLEETPDLAHALTRLGGRLKG